MQITMTLIVGAALKKPNRGDAMDLAAIVRRTLRKSEALQMPVAAATIARVVGRLSEAQVRALLVDILVGATEPLAQPKRILTRTAPEPETVRSGCSVIDLATRKPYAANRKPKRNAAKSGNVAPGAGA